MLKPKQWQRRSRPTSWKRQGRKKKKKKKQVAASNKERKAAREEKLRSGKIPQTRRTKGRRGRTRRKLRTPSRSRRGGRRWSGENAKKPGATPEKTQERERGAKKTQAMRENPGTQGRERKHHRRNNIGHRPKDMNQMGRGKTRERGPPGEGRKRRH